MLAGLLLLIGQVLALLLQLLRQVFQSVDLHQHIRMDLVPLFAFDVSFVLPVRNLILHLLKLYFLIFLHFDQLILAIIHSL